MKALKNLVITSLLASGIAGSASANTLQYVHIAGAPAYRQNGNDAISAVVATFTGAGLIATSASGTTAANIESAKQNQWYIPNYVSGSIDLVVDVTWSGSTGGFASVASGSITQLYIADPTTTQTVGIAATKAAVASSYQPDFTLSDTFQATTIYNGTVKLEGPTQGAFFTKTYQALHGSLLGVEPYRWVASPGAAAAGLTNLTTLQARLLFINGSLPLSFFTGNHTDEATTVYALSRDPGSGSRLVALSETGVGAQTTIYTYKPTVSGGAPDSQGNYVGGTITDDPTNPTVYPHGLIPSTGVYDENDGDTGYPSFGTTVQGTGELQAITATPPAGAIFVTYLNIDDSTEASAAGSSILSWNGITYNSTAVSEGLYTFWSYEQLFAPTALTTSVANGYGVNQSSFASKLVTKFPTYAEVPFANLEVSKLQDGGVVTPNF
jgi:hypothetical protein